MSFSSLWSCRHRILFTFWDFGHQLTAKNFVVFFDRIILYLSLHKIDITVLLVNWNDLSLDLARWFCRHGSLLYLSAYLIYHYYNAHSNKMQAQNGVKPRYFQGSMLRSESKMRF